VAADAYYARLKSYYAAIRAAGGLMIACTCLPIGTQVAEGGPSGTWETYGHGYLNTLIRAGLGTDFDRLADIGNPALSIMGDVATCQNPIYYNAPDGMHPLTVGHALLAPILTTEIQSLL